MKIETIFMIALDVLLCAGAFLLVVDATVQLIRAAAHTFRPPSRHQVSRSTNSVREHGVIDRLIHIR